MDDGERWVRLDGVRRLIDGGAGNSSAPFQGSSRRAPDGRKALSALPRSAGPATWAQVVRPFGTRVGLLLALAAGWGCQSPPDSVESLLSRHRQAVAPLPVEDRGRIVPRPSALDPSVADAARPEASLPAGELTLEAARQAALRGNPDVRVADARLQSALARIGESRAAFYPTVSLGWTSSRTFLVPALQSGLVPPITPTIPFNLTQDQLTLGTLLNVLSQPLLLQRGLGESGEQNSFSQHTGTVSLTWQIFDGFAREARLLAVKHNFRAAEHQVNDVQRLLISAVDTAYFQALLGREQLRVAMADEVFSREQLAEAERKFAAQTVTADEVSSFKARVAAAQAQLTAARGTFESGRVILAELTGFSDAKLPDEVELSPLIAETPDELAPPDVEAWIAAAERARPDLAEAQQRVEAARENERVARAQYVPTINLNATYGVDKRSSIDISEDDQTAGMAVEVRWPIFDADFRTFQVRRAEADRREAEARRTGIRNAIASQVRRAAIALVSQQDQIAAQRASVAQWAESRSLLQVRYRAGQASWVELNQVQQNYVEAEFGLAGARIRLRQAWSDLEAATGTAISPPTR